MKIETFNDKILINNRYEVYKDGVIYDTQKAKDIPQWIFDFINFVVLSVKEEIERENERNKKA